MTCSAGCRYSKPNDKLENYKVLVCPLAAHT